MGISWNEMNAKQKKLSFLLLQSFLSGKAYQQSQDIIKLENILKQMEPHRESWVRDPGNYKFVFLATPSKKKPMSGDLKVIIYPLHFHQSIIPLLLPPPLLWEAILLLYLQVRIKGRKF
jgi:hypothetical protein